MAKARQPKSDPLGLGASNKKAAADAARAQKRRVTASTMGNAAKRRKAWERSPEGKARSKDIQALYGTKISHAQIYHMKGWSESKDVGLGVQQLPGMENPHEAETPKRWEEHTPEEQERTHRALKTFGTSLEKMSEDFGSQLDQAHYRAAQYDQEPHAKRFYEPGEEKHEVISASARKMGVPFGVHVAAVSFTSPNTKFSQKLKSGETVHPNVEAAEMATRAHQRGVPAREITNEPTERGPKAQGYPANLQKVGHMHEQLAQGVPFKELRGFPSKSSPQGTKMLGPKTGPFHNAWLPDVPDFFVADVHSGGGGMLPHLSPDKPVHRLESGFVGGKKSEREAAIDRIPNFHAAADYAARQALQKRGLGTSSRQAQAAQWGEEQIQRGERQRESGHFRGGFPTEDVFKDRREKPEHPGQGKLF